MPENRLSMCKTCLAYCPVEVTVENGRAVKVVGDRQSPLYKGYTCPKGRALPEAHNHPDRLLHSRKRRGDGAFEAIPTERAIGEVAEKLKAIIDEHGPAAGRRRRPGPDIWPAAHGRHPRGHRPCGMTPYH